MLPTVEAGSEIMSKSFYVIPNGVFVLRAYILFSSSLVEMEGFVCEHTLLPLHFVHDVTLFNLIQIPFVQM